MLVNRVKWLKKCLIIFFVIVIFLAGVYVAFDQYFRLPNKQSKGKLHNDKTTKIIENKSITNYDFGNFNILILGLDGRKGLNDRTDTIILASLDEDTKKAQLLSIPRDCRVKIKGRWDKINAAYVYGGLDLTKETVTNLLGVDIDRYVILNFNGLIKLVDLVDGIDVNVPVRMYKPLEGINLRPGQQHLNGKQVLAYIRFRGTKNGDIDRARRQQEVLRLLSEKVTDDKNLVKFLDIIESAKEEVKTDLTVKEIGALARLASPVLKNGIATKVLPGYNQKIDEIWYWQPDLTNLSEIVAISKKENVVRSNVPDTHKSS